MILDAALVRIFATAFKTSVFGFQADGNLVAITVILVSQLATGPTFEPTHSLCSRARPAPLRFFLRPSAGASP